MFVYLDPPDQIKYIFCFWLDSLFIVEGYKAIKSNSTINRSGIAGNHDGIASLNIIFKLN